MRNTECIINFLQIFCKAKNFKQMKKVFITVLALGIYAGSLMAQFSLSGEFRPRTEYAHGLKSLAHADQNSALFTSQRTRLNLGYNAEAVKVGLVLQDVRFWGSQKQLVTNEDYAVSVHQAWAEVAFCNHLALKAGRQELAYDNHRILGNVGWAQQARSHDVALLKYVGGVNVHLGFAYHQDGNLNKALYTGPDAYKAIQFLWVNKTLDATSVSFLALNNGVVVNTLGEDESIINQEINYGQTIGLFGNTKLGPVALEANAYYQMGKDAGDKDISAFEFLLMASINLGSKTKLAAGFEHLSGTDYNAASDVNNSFNPLYGTNHKFNGFMDYFYVGNHINSFGLNDAFLSATFTPCKLSAKADLHLFSTAAKMSADGGNALGTELDITLSYPIHNDAKIAVGYSQMFATENMEMLKGGSKDELNNWAYIMLTVTPKFFK